MIHTMEIYCRISYNTMIEYLQMLRISGETCNSRLEYRANEKYYDIPGVRYIVFRRRRITDQVSCCVVKMLVEPQMMLTGFRTVDLFSCTAENIQLFEQLFYDYMMATFHDESLCRIACWHLSRIDYAVNLYCDNVPLFLALAHKSDRKMMRQPDGRHESLEKNRKASKFIAYNKQQQITDATAESDDGDNAELQLYAEESQNIIRVEYQCRYRKLAELRYRKDLHDETNFSTAFLSETIAEQLLQREYATTIGTGDFYKLNNDGKNRINHSNLKPGMKQKLIEFIQLCAQTRHVLEARKQFVVGAKIKHTNIVVKGSSDMFRKRIKQLEALGIAPVPIPKDWYTNGKYGHIPNVFPNPIPERWKNR